MFASNPTNRRDFLKQSATGAAALATGLLDGGLLAQEPGMRPVQADEVAVRNPRGRVPMSMIIDDSTCLVNLAHFAIPQFHEVFPDRYQQPWRRLPREIPDRFVRKFGEWCHEHGIKGKYSIVPYPACVGWMDRQLPGWSKKPWPTNATLCDRIPSASCARRWSGCITRSSGSPRSPTAYWVSCAHLRRA